ncbi:Icc protein [Psychrobacter sp. PL15]|uniref:metallophosphoesterase n=1 Tax=Psychrobacter sp. PL15 TaxID=3071719 RepID=UPI002E07FE2B|nr:Icc protein [Psychrobacter sp. PL15]
MLSYPARRIYTPDEHVNVLQITDLHLSAHYPITSSTIAQNDDLTDSICQENFEASLRQALNEDIRCDLILVTGDLVSQVEPAIYDHIFKILKATNIPFACIAGNHDVTDEIVTEVPFFQRETIAQAADERLLSRHVIDTDYWQLLLLDSAIPGKVAGEVTDTDIDWLCEQLTADDKPALIAIHHHVLPMRSDWIDAHIAENTESFWQRMMPFDHLRVIISGHTHQEQVRYRQGVTVYSTPSTCYQFEPYKNDFTYDHNANPGYRWLQLANNGQVASWVKRLDT